MSEPKPVHGRDACPKTPGDGVQALQKQVSRLRQRLGPALPLWHGAVGYAVDIDEGTVDVHRFEQLLRRARVELARGEAGPARDDLESALRLWRGQALADHRFEPFAQAEIGRLEELRIEALEERTAAELGAGPMETMILAHDPELTADRSPRTSPRPLPAPADELIGRERRMRTNG